jgi:pyruvate dehydrogenase E2 component (dihydrolipoamide acetyltransferase)
VASDVIMPKMGYDMTSGVLARWLKHPGDKVRRGEPIAEVETDKVTIEIEAFGDGTIGKLLVNEGDRVPVGAPIATLETTIVPTHATDLRPVGAGEGGEAIPTKERAGAAEATVVSHRTGPATTPGREGRELARPQAGGPMPAGMSEPEEPPPSGGEDRGRIKASPLARKLAATHGVDLATISGTGPSGRIIKADIESQVQQPEGRVEPERRQPPTAAAPTAPPQPAPAPAAAPPRPAPTPTAGPQRAPAAQPATAGERIELSRAMQAVGRIMAASKQSVPHFYVTLPIAMDDALALRAELNAVLPDDAKVGVVDLIVKATALALADTPAFCRLYTADGPIQAGGIHVAVAVALPDGAIVSPVLRDADRMPLTAMAKRSRRLFRDARDGRLSVDAMQDAIFTVSSLGSVGVESFAAIITPPQSGVLAVGSITPEPVVRDGDIDVEQRMRLTLSADHRLVGGVGAADFLHKVRDRLEAPYRLLIDTEAPAA